MKQSLAVYLILLCIASAGCATSPPVRLYVLNPTSSKADTRNQDLPILVHLQIHVPDYLDRPQIVVRQGENRLSLAELDRWAEPLSRMLPRVLSQELANSTLPLQVAPSSSAGTDYNIWIQILRLDGKPGGQVHLRALWRIRRGDSDRGLMRTHLFSRTARVSGQGMEGLVQAHELLLDQLAGEVSRMVQANQES